MSCHPLPLPFGMFCSIYTLTLSPLCVHFIVTFLSSHVVVRYCAAIWLNFARVCTLHVGQSFCNEKGGQYSVDFSKLQQHHNNHKVNINNVNNKGRLRTCSLRRTKFVACETGAGMARRVSVVATMCWVFDVDIFKA